MLFNSSTCHLIAEFISFCDTTSTNYCFSHSPNNRKLIKHFCKDFNQTRGVEYDTNLGVMKNLEALPFQLSEKMKKHQEMICSKEVQNRADLW